MAYSSLAKAWLNLQPNALQANIIFPWLVQYVLPRWGYDADKGEIVQSFSTGHGAKKVDIAAKMSSGGKTLQQSPQNPFLIIEVKNRNIDLSFGSQGYENAVGQLKGYLSPQSVHCAETQWGILTNANHIQLFRRHGKVIYPYTENIKLQSDTIDSTIALLKNYINNLPRALVIALYNNKGGVGKTTTAINLASILALAKPNGFGKKVLVIDFDPNQKDLTNLLGVKSAKVSLFEYFKKIKTLNVQDIISGHYVLLQNGVEKKFFDVIPADEYLLDLGSTASIGQGSLWKVVKKLVNNYDYIIIDAPPGNGFFTQEALVSSDVVLMPAKHNGLASLHNAAFAALNLLPKVGAERREKDENLKYFAAPTPLPIFFNGENTTPASLMQAQKEINIIINNAPASNQLHQVFFPSIFEIPNFSAIASAGFTRRSGVLSHKTARSYYKQFVEEYFI